MRVLAHTFLWVCPRKSIQPALTAAIPPPATLLKPLPWPTSLAQRFYAFSLTLFSRFVNIFFIEAKFSSNTVSHAHRTYINKKGSFYTTAPCSQTTPLSPIFPAIPPDHLPHPVVTSIDGLHPCDGICAIIFIRHFGYICRYH